MNYIRKLIARVAAAVRVLWFSNKENDDDSNIVRAYVFGKWRKMQMQSVVGMMVRSVSRDADTTVLYAIHDAIIDRRDLKRFRRWREKNSPKVQ